MTMMIKDLVSTYLDHLLVERGLSANTVAAYRRDLDRYVRQLAGTGVDRLEAVTPAMITDYASQLAEGVRDEADPERWRHPPLARASVARAVVAVRNLHRFAVEERHTEDNPAAEVQPPAPARRLPKALPLDAVQRLLETPAPDTPLGLRDRALLELLYGTGTRIGELVALDVDDISRALDLPAEQTAAIRVLGKGGKERLVPLGRYARAATSAYLTRARPELARRGRGTPALLVNARGGRLSRQSAWTILRSVAERAGITTEISPHTLRHSFATHLLDGGADVRVVQELLGHASVTTTQIYTLVTVDHLREVYLTAHPRAR